MKESPRYTVTEAVMQDVFEVTRIVGSEKEIIKTFPLLTPDSEIAECILEDGKRWNSEQARIEQSKRYIYRGTGEISCGGTYESYVIFEEAEEGVQRTVATVQTRLDTWNIIGLLNQAWEEREAIKREKDKKVSLDTQKFYLEEIKSLVEVLKWFHRENPEANTLLMEYANYSHGGMSLTQARKFHQKLNRFFSEIRGGY